ncbi:acetolactate synthase [Candidatus Karelsulcia muelleri]|uniref:acetolactate synthase n=1 Tax=Candidatus Karelsulcia muelleri TaxID=336810 RepID=UPI000B92D4BC|nr:acetolactate synthase [Candidatus Karelsulcia muelleri]ASS47008.1 Putative acetolactate synthase small subunit [Candidatus Karelsulcia muelleri]
MKKINIIIISDNIIGFLIRIILIFNRRNININNIILINKKLYTNYVYIIKIEIKNYKIYNFNKIIKQIKRIIGIKKIYFYNLK